MSMSNSSLVSYTKLSPNCDHPRTHAIDKITIHHMAGDLSVETCGNLFAKPSYEASSNYGIGSDGRVGLYVDEGDRAWASASPSNDNRAVNIEVANCATGGDWPVSSAAYNKLIDLCVDICQRNGIKALNYTGDTDGNLTEHRMFVATACPGPYLHERMGRIAAEVNSRLSAQPAKSVDEVAREVIRGEWGNGSDRRQRLEAAGYDYDAVQNHVNAILTGDEPEQPAPAEPVEPAPEQPATDKLYRVQVGAFANRENAEKMLRRLKDAGFEGYIREV
nr:MAG TPA_asm: peptidoglycan hydrolase [Caudoviricetes sp.]